MSPLSRLTRGRAASHSEAAHVPGGGAVRDLVFGANDGLVAAFAVVTGLHGATTASRVVFAGGLAELLGGTIAMSLGAWLATKSAHEYYVAEHAREEYEVEHFPELERAEVRDAFAKEGFTGDVLDRVVEHVTADRRRWVKTMMDRELGLAPVAEGAARRAGLATGCAYAVGAAMPTAPYAFAGALAFPLSIALTALTLFLVGAAKTRVTGARWWKSGLESLGIGALAAAATFLVGRLVGSA
jgi:VIT1/CCC1 family predicted Fe2+/Mn2+ transporter